jgi:hypothetical protein
MKNAILKLGDRMLATFLPTEQAAACVVACGCNLFDCEYTGEPACPYYCLQKCFAANCSTVCLSGWTCAN